MSFSYTLHEYILQYVLVISLCKPNNSKLLLYQVSQELHNAYVSVFSLLSIIVLTSFPFISNPKICLFKSLATKLWNSLTPLTNKQKLTYEVELPYPIYVPVPKVFPKLHINEYCCDTKTWALATTLNFLIFTSGLNPVSIYCVPLLSIYPTSWYSAGNLINDKNSNICLRELILPLHNYCFTILNI